MAKKAKAAKAENDAGKEADVERDDDADAPEGEGGDADAGEAKKKLSGRTIVLFIALPALVVIGLSVGALFMFGVLGGGGHKDEAAAQKTEAAAAVFFDLPELLVNLNAEEAGHESLLKISMALELPSSDTVPKIEAAMPRIVDGAQVFLREMRLADLDGSAGMLKLREELLKRVNAAVAPVSVRDVLFKEIIVQ